MKIGTLLLFSAKIFASMLLGIVVVVGTMITAWLSLASIFSIFSNPGMSLLGAGVAVGSLSITYVAYSLIRKLFDNQMHPIEPGRTKPISNAEAFRKMY